jgi:hypothetical protein
LPPKKPRFHIAKHSSYNWTPTVAARLQSRIAIGYLNSDLFVPPPSHSLAHPLTHSPLPFHSTFPPNPASITAIASKSARAE